MNWNFFLFIVARSSAIVSQRIVGDANQYKILQQQDRGIFEKYTGDLDDQEAIMAWYDSLPKGAVFINNGMFDTDSIYIVKDAPAIFGTGVSQ